MNSSTSNYFLVLPILGSLSLLNATDNDELNCNSVHSIKNADEQCEFILNTTSCSYDGFIYNYLEMTFCDLIEFRPVVYLILFSILFILFVSMGIIADDFLCPSLLTISKTFHLPDNIAGVTFLAFGNGAPDIFASIGGISHSKPQMIFSSLYGAGIFVTTIVVGSILLVGQFKVMKRPLIRDIVFYIGATFIVWLFIHQKYLKLAHAIGLVCFYLFYISVILISRLIYMKFNKRKKDKDDKTNTEKKESISHIQIPKIITEQDQVDINPNNLHVIQNNLNVSLSKSTDSWIHIVPQRDSRNPSVVSFQSNLSNGQENKSRTDSIDDDVILARFYRTGTMRSTRSRSRSSARQQHLAHHHWSNTMRSLSKTFESFEQKNSKRFSMDNNFEMKISKEEEKEEKRKEISKSSELGTEKPSYMSQFSMLELMSESRNFLLHICPIDILEWDQYSTYKKIFEIIKSIPYFIMTICIPVVDLESINENWCRFLICINVILGPQMVLLLKQVDYELHGFPCWAIVFIITILLSLIILLTSNKHRPPPYNRLFSFIGFILSVIVINSIADEIINVLQAFGILLRLSDSILGLTILAWGNSLGDLISNLSMARHGHHSMAIAACFGGPMLNLLMGLGVPYLILFLNGHKSVVLLEYTNMITLLYATIALSLMISLVTFILKRFNSTKIHGFILIALYFIYLGFAILLEYKVLGNQHNQKFNEKL